MECEAFCHPYEIGKTMQGQLAFNCDDQLMKAEYSGVDPISWIDLQLEYASPSDIEAAAAAEVRRHLEIFLEKYYCKASLKMTAGSMYIPKDNPEQPRGEDAHFISAEKQTIGVADGVGGWITKGIDSGEYARQLMNNSALALHDEPEGEVNPKRVLQEAYNATTAQGSSTACIITLSGDRLRAANVGDSGFLVIRNGTVVYTSPTQQRRFNCPHQLGKTKDDPSVASEIEVAVKKGDIIVAGSDGLLDNMDGREIVEALSEVMREKGVWEQASYIANAALYNSFDRFTDTPFSKASRDAGGNHRGGKPDDITVIIARIED